jgi:hypothetical protein
MTHKAVPTTQTTIMIKANNRAIQLLRKTNRKTKLERKNGGDYTYKYIPQNKYSIAFLNISTLNDRLGEGRGGSWGHSQNIKFAGILKTRHEGFLISNLGVIFLMHIPYPLRALRPQNILYVFLNILMPMTSWIDVFDEKAFLRESKINLFQDSLQ